MKNILLASVAVATLIASPALARTPTKHHQPVATDALVAAPVYARSGVVIVGGQVVGQDPDAFIRAEIARDAYSYQN